MDHEAAQALFSELEDGELKGEPRAQLDAHLAGCEACRGELEAFRRTLSAMRGAAATQTDAAGPSPEFIDSLKQQIHTRSRGRFFGPRRRRYKLEIVSLVTLLVAMTVYLTLYLAQPMWLVR